MKRILIVLQLLAFLAIRSQAGKLSYQAVQSDADCGISTQSQYTSAVDGGNTSGTDRLVNGITLSALEGDGQSSTADNCTLNALSGSLSNGEAKSSPGSAEGSLGQVLSDVTINDGATDDSQQEIVLDPESLDAGATYDLRVYVGHGAGQERQVNLSFVGDGEPPVETGFFNEDDARTSAGGFKDANQMYYISYVFTWDGDSTPGITITQKSGNAPFVLYALTNQLMSGGGTARSNAGGNEALQGAAGQGGVSMGLVDNESDEVGVESDDFYNSESLNSNGKWIGVGKYGRCWQPTNVASGWAPYTNGSFQNCDDCGATFVSDEPWAWACYHYGRWLKVSYGCGWAWVPGKVWAGSWVSWRRGKTESCSCIGWAPLPPEAGCQVDVGISSWVDETCNIGPEYYTFVNVWDFGRESYFGCGCMYERSRNVTVIIDTINITNICYGKHVNIYCGGPDFKWCNTEIRKHGGRECENIHVNRYDDPGKMGGKFSKHEGNQLGLLSPHIKGEKNSKHAPKVAEHLGEDKIDKGWGKDKNAEKRLKNHIAEENGGKNPKNNPARLTGNDAKQMKHGAGNQHPGKHNKGTGVEPLMADGQGQGTGGGGFTKHAAGKHNKGQTGNNGIATGGSGQGGGGFNQHPGKGKNKGKNADGNANNLLGGQNGGGGTGKHPGQKRSKSGLAGADQTGEGGGAGNQHGGKGKNKNQNNFGNTENAGGGTGTGKHKGKNQGQALNQGAGDGQTGGTGQGGGTGKHHKGKSQGQTFNQGAGAEQTGGGTGQGGAAGGGGKHHKQKSQGQTFTPQNAGQGGNGAGGGGGGSGKHHKNQGQTQNQMMMQNQGGQTGGGSGGRHHKQQQMQQQQFQQGQNGGNQGGGGGGGKGKKHKGSPTPNPALLSDLRTKTDVRFVGTSRMGIPVYEFSYKSEPNKRYRGTIAQAIARSRPEAVIWRNGLMYVDYSQLDVQMTELPPKD